MFFNKMFAALCACLVVSGCAGIPKLDIQSSVTVANIIDRIQCEAYEAATRHPALKKERWVGAADLFLQVDDNAALTPSLTYIEPLVNAGTSWAIGASGTIRRGRQRVYNESVTFELAKLTGKSCSNIVPQYDLEGDLGIVETLEIAKGSFNERDQVKFAEKQAVGQTLQFVLTRNIAGGPTFTLTRFVGAGPIAGAERIDTHKLIVSFAPGATVKTVIDKDGKPRVIKSSGGGAGAAISNNQKLLFNSLPAFQVLR